MSSSQFPSKLTPVHDAARELGAQFTESGGWLQLQVFSTVEEEETVARRGVALADHSASGKIVVEGRAAEALLQAIWSVPSLATGEGIIVDSKGFFRLREDQFFIHLEPGAERAAEKSLTGAVDKHGQPATVTDITHGRADLLLIGPRSRELLGRLCSLDLHPRQFPDLSAKLSSVAKTRQLILRHDLKLPAGSPIPAFSLIGDRSLAAYLWQTILEAGHDLDLVPLGRLALERLRAGK